MSITARRIWCVWVCSRAYMHLHQKNDLGNQKRDVYVRQEGQHITSLVYGLAFRYYKKNIKVGMRLTDVCEGTK